MPCSACSPSRLGKQNDGALLALAHLLGGFPDDQERPAHIDAHDLLEIIDRCLEDRPAPAQHAGAGNRHINVAKLAARGGEGVNDDLLVARVALESHCLAANLLDLACGLSRRARSPVENGDVCPKVGQCQSRFAADARAAAGHERHLALVGKAGKCLARGHGFAFIWIAPLWVGAPPPGNVMRHRRPA